MTLQVAGSHALARPASGFLLPAVIADAGDQAANRFVEFFTATIRNAAHAQSLRPCRRRFLRLVRGHRPHPARHRAAARRRLRRAAHRASKSAPTVKQHLAAIRMLLRLAGHRRRHPLQPGQLGPRPEIHRQSGKTPVLTAEEARQLLDSIDTGHA